MPSVFIYSSMTQNGVEKSLTFDVREDDGGEHFAILNGGPFNGCRLTRTDLLNLSMHLGDIAATIKEVQDGTGQFA